MAYKKRRKRQSYRAKKRYGSYKRKPYNNKRTGGLLGIEHKYHDVTLAPTGIPITVASANMDPLAGCLNGIAEGSGPKQHDGRNYVITNINIAGSLWRDRWLPDSANSNNKGMLSQTVRLIILQDKQTNGASYTPTEVLSGGGMYSFRNLEFTKRYRVLYDKIFDLNSAISMAADGATYIAAAGTVARSFRINKAVRIKVQTVVGGSGATIGDIADNSIHVMCFSEDSIDAYLKYEARIRYYG